MLGQWEEALDGLDVLTESHVQQRIGFIQNKLSHSRINGESDSEEIVE
jgi:hypothetical protein